MKGLSCWAHFAKEKGVAVPGEVYSFLNAATFSTLTNVNFDDARFKEYITACHALRDEVEASIDKDCCPHNGNIWNWLLLHGEDNTSIYCLMYVFDRI